MPTSSLDEVARRLKNPRIDKVVAGYSEMQASRRRVVLLAIYLVWVMVWAYGGIVQPESSSLAFEARRLAPAVMGLLIASMAWAVYLAEIAQTSTRVIEIAGAIGNYFVIWLLLHLGWNVSIAVITLLPLATIVMGARFSRRTFYWTMAGSVVLLGIAAPPGYWLARPAFIPFALVLLIGLPLTVNRLLGALHEVSAAALLARDAQARFLAMVSHELRTPLNTICVTSQLLDPRALDEPGQQLVFALRTNADALLARINQLLDVASLDNGRLALQIQPFSVHGVLEAVRGIIGPAAEAKGVRLAFQAGSVPAWLLGDPGRIEQVLTNLAGNAIKFTPAGGSVLIGAGCDPARNTTDAIDLHFFVRDSGRGMTPEQMARMFEPFYQASAGTTRQEEGVGLGLHIVSRLSALMDGQLSAVQRPGGGTEFTWALVLPQVQAGPSRSAATDIQGMLATHKKSTRPMTCLVIDDSTANLEIMRHILDAAGHQAIIAASGPLGIRELWNNGAVDVVLLDLHMPRISGVKVLQSLRTHRPQLPVVLITADADKGTEADILSAGARAVLTKPVSMPKLLEVLEQIAVGSMLSVGFQGEVPENSPIQMVRLFGDLTATSRFLQSLYNDLQQGEMLLGRAVESAEISDFSDSLHRLLNAFGNAGDTVGLDLIRAVPPAFSKGDIDAAALAIRARVQVVLVSIQAEPEFGALG